MYLGQNKVIILCLKYYNDAMFPKNIKVQVIKINLPHNYSVIKKYTVYILYFNTVSWKIVIMSRIM